MSFFSPLLAGVGLSFFTYLGYPIWFGYKGKRGNSGIENIDIDNDGVFAVLPSIFLGAFFLIITGLIWHLG